MSESVRLIPCWCVCWCVCVGVLVCVCVCVCVTRQAVCVCMCVCVRVVVISCYKTLALILCEYNWKFIMECFGFHVNLRERIK